MEIANKIPKDSLIPPVPTSVKRSSLPNAESTRTPVKEKSAFRGGVESTTSEVGKPKVEEVKEPIFSRSDEPEIKGTIVITVFKNHPYEIEFSGIITGLERDLAVKFLYKEYMVWKNKLAKENEAKIKTANAAKKEDTDARN